MTLRDCDRTTEHSENYSVPDARFWELWLHSGRANGVPDEHSALAWDVPRC